MPSSNPDLTTRFRLPTPKPSDPPDIPGDMKALADEVDRWLFSFSLWTWKGTASFNNGEWSVSHGKTGEPVWAGITLRDATTPLVLSWKDVAGTSTLDFRAWVSNTGALFTGQAKVMVIGFWNRVSTP